MNERVTSDGQRAVLASTETRPMSREIRALFVIPFAALLLAALLSAIDVVQQQDPSRGGAPTHHIQ